jgi:endonuclease/exonuclease/phosphatase family metal-dependent hydrolase
MIMSKLRAGWCLVLLVMVSMVVQAAPLKVATLNLEWFPGQSARSVDEEEAARHIAEARAVLEEINPDILVATEVCDPGAFEQIISGMEGLSMHVISNFKREQDEQETNPLRDQQIAIATRLKPVAAWAEPWAVTIDGLSRGYAMVALENPDTGKLIVVYGLHLKSNRSSSPEQEQLNYDLRDESVRQLVAHMTRIEGDFASVGVDAWIVAGDVNTNHDGVFGDRVVEMIEEAGFWNTFGRVPPEERPTWKGRYSYYPPGTLDYIFVKNLGEPDAAVVEIPYTVSDHNAVVVEVELPVAHEEVTDAQDQ